MPPPHRHSLSAMIGWLFCREAHPNQGEKEGNRHFRRPIRKACGVPGLYMNQACQPWDLQTPMTRLIIRLPNMEVAVKRIILVCLVSVAGCQSVKTAMEYDPQVHQVQMEDDTYRVFEHPQRDRLMTTPSMGKIAGQGMAQGVTLGIAHIRTPEQRHEAAARRYLDDTGRAHCRISKGYLLVDPQYEFYFNCDAPLEPATN